MRRIDLHPTVAIPLPRVIEVVAEPRAGVDFRRAAEEDDVRRADVEDHPRFGAAGRGGGECEWGRKKCGENRKEDSVSRQNAHPSRSLEVKLLMPRNLRPVRTGRRKEEFR